MDIEPEKNSQPEKKSPPKPEEVQREIEAFMRQKFGDDIKIITQEVKAAPNEKTKEPAVLPPNPNLNEVVDVDDFEEIEELDLSFNYRPKEVKEYLDQYIIGQEQAKKVLSIAVCDHYNHIQECNELNSQNYEDDGDNYTKQNVLLLGPTGVGKTYLVKMIAKLIGVPFVKADATRFTETGFVGANVDDMVRDLVSMADDNIEEAQYGIIYFDEADKIAGGHSNMGGKDISGRGVQNALLKLMEETDIDLSGSHDMISQMRAFMDFQKNGKVTKKVVNTKHILFIVSGAFYGLEDIIKKRLKMNTIGLNVTKPVQLQKDEKNIFQYVSTKDLVDFGLEPEFVGRLPVRSNCNRLSEEDLYLILKNAKGSIINQYTKAFRAYGIAVEFTDCALREIAHLALEEKTGARALMTVCESILRDFKFELPSTHITAFTITKETVKDPQKELLHLLTDLNTH
ncbi:MAG: AAA family ATPase [Bacteriovoracaceae bacterium]|nr:AAA family ATPase [Bacteriovoracaceae bacterium]